MPTNHGRKTTIQLSVAELGNVITQNPQNRQCAQTTSSITKTDLEFIETSKDGTLAEQPLNGKDDSHLQFLGKHEDMPFFMVRAGKELFNPNALGRRNRRPAKTVKQQKTDRPAVYDEDDDGAAQDPSKNMPNVSYRPPMVPHGLCITVFLSKTSFTNTTYEKGLKKISKHDIKIDVFFNGQFADSQTITHKHFNCSGSRGMGARIVRFTGQKLSRMIEKPWVLLPPDRTLSQTSSGFLRRDSLESLDASSRWSAVSKHILVEADAVGREISGDRRVTGQYLESLASLTMPPEVSQMEEGDCLAFGVIDVVVSWGSGHKNGPDTAYLTKPTRSLPSRYHAKLDGDTLEHDIEETNEDAIPKTREEALAKALTLDGVIDEPPKPSNRLIRELFPPDRARGGTPKRQREPSALENKKVRPKRRKAIHYHHVLTTKQTLSEELQSIAEKSFANVQKGRTRSTLTQASSSDAKADSSPLSSLPSVTEEVSLIEVPKPRKIVTLKISPQKLATSPSKGGVPSSDGVPRQRQSGSARPRRRISTDNSIPSSQLTTQSSPNLVDPMSSSPEAADTRATTVSGGDVQDSTPIPRGKTSRLAVKQEVFDADFILPELCQDCCITYAEPGVVRNVGAVRGGWFEERGVLMGTRFIVG